MVATSTSASSRSVATAARHLVAVVAVAASRELALPIAGARSYWVSIAKKWLIWRSLSGQVPLKKSQRILALDG